MNVSGRNKFPNGPLLICTDRHQKHGQQGITSIRNPPPIAKEKLSRRYTHPVEDAILEVNLDTPRDILDLLPMIDLCEVDANLQKSKWVRSLQMQPTRAL